MVQAPDIVSGMQEERDLLNIHPGFLQAGCCKGLHGRIIYIDQNLFTCSKLSNKLAVIRINSIYLSGPGSFFMRPAQPGGFMWRKFGREVITQLFWCWRM